MPGIAPSLSPAVLGDSFAVSGGSGHSATSSLPPTGGEASGLASGMDTSGPWWIEEQRANITYFRAPKNNARQTEMHAYNFSLSGSQPGDNNIVSGSIYSTDLFFKADLYTAGFWSDDMYGTSSNVVLQKFMVLPASSDMNGNTYGSLSAGCFGPQGEIVTSQPYHSRTPYSGQTNYASATVGYNYAPYDAGTFNWTDVSSNPTVATQEDAYGNYMYFFNRWLPDDTYRPWPTETYLKVGSTCAISHQWNGVGTHQTGSYDSTLETSDLVSHWINSVCVRMQSGHNLYNHDYAVPAFYSTYGSSFSKHKLGELYTRGVIANAYSTNRHDFS